MEGPARDAQDRQGGRGRRKALQHRQGDQVSLDRGWVRPEPGARVRQTVAYGPFVVQLREDMGYGGARLTRHRGATETTFVVLGYWERSEIGLPAHVVQLRDERDGREYVVDTGLCGPGLPLDAFVVIEARSSSA